MGFYAPAQLVQDARHHGVPVRVVDVNSSDYDSTLEMGDTFIKLDNHARQTLEPALRIGLRMVKGLSESGARAIVEARQKQAFVTIQDLVFRSGINKKDLEALAAADALRELSGDRHRAFWQASGIESKESADRYGTVPLDFEGSSTDFGVDVLLPVASEGQNIVGDYNATGLTLRRHPLALFRGHLDCYQVNTASQLQSVDNESEGVVHLIARDLVDLSHWLGDLEVASRNFT